jgi:ADP-dependent NAD(P)H-hydrate dehydratase / NAD(P)H-hydrate epimerase
MSRPQHIDFPAAPWPLHDATATRHIEARAAAALPPHTLMQRAGESVARLALALAPHAQRIWVVAGPGNNGGDGFEAALHLQGAGKQVQINIVGDPARQPADAAASRHRAQAAGVNIEIGLPSSMQADLAIDALLGLGATRAATGAMAAAIALINSLPGPRLAIDLPSGLDPDRGSVWGDASIQASHTLALLTLKPGLYTAHGRDRAGDIWFDDLDVGALALQGPPARAWLGSADAVRQLRAPRHHAQHKGSFGQVLVVGGAAGMTGAALLAGRAALAAGAGRVYVSLLDSAAPGHDPLWPELMLRPAGWRDSAIALSETTVVCGCGGGELVREALPALLARAARLVLDADALNAAASGTALQTLLAARADKGLATVLTPHPLEAARLAGSTDAALVQADRLIHAEQLAARYGCVVLLKGSGTVIAAPNQITIINPTGNARLASAGTGDVLAGWLGGLWAAAQAPGQAPPPMRVAQAAAWLHGVAAAGGDDCGPLPASALLGALAPQHPAALRQSRY